MIPQNLIINAAREVGFDLVGVVRAEAMTTEPYAFAFMKGSDDLVNEINTILEKLVTDGTVKAIFEKYNAPYTSPKN